MVHLLLTGDCAQVSLPTSAVQGLRGLGHLGRLRAPAHPVPPQPPHLALHSAEEVQHAAVRKVPRVLAARLIEELLLQVHIVAPVSALQEDCLVEAGPQAAGQEGQNDEQQGDTPAYGLGVGSKRLGVGGAWVLYSRVARVFQSLSLHLGLSSFLRSIHRPV